MRNGGKNCFWCIKNFFIDSNMICLINIGLDETQTEWKRVGVVRICLFNDFYEFFFEFFCNMRL